MASYTIIDGNRIEIDFHGIKPNSAKLVWHGPLNPNTLLVAKEICGESLSKPMKKRVQNPPTKDYALKVKIKDIIDADNSQLEKWAEQLKRHVDEIMGEDNSSHSENAVRNYAEIIHELT